MRSFKSILVLSFFAFLSLAHAFGQTPGLINYQAVARSTQTGVELANTEIFISCIIRAGGPNGAIVFQENHGGVSTDQFGLFSIQIGGGSVVTGSLVDIDWAAGSYWLDTEVDAGEGLQSAGSLQLVSVPYALHARTADIVDDADANPSNELVEGLTLSSTGTLTLEQNDGASNLSVDLSDFNSSDNDPTNEFVTDFIFNEETRDLTIEQGDGPVLTTNIGSVNDADADPTNELVNALDFNDATRTITLDQNDGSSLSVNIGGIDDADADPTNELADDLEFTVGTRTLELTQGDGSTLSTSIPFPEALWEFNEPAQAVFNNSNRIGIGTDEPAAKLSVQPTSNAEPALEVLSSTGETLIEAKDGAIGIGAVNNTESSILLGSSIAVNTHIIESAAAPIVYDVDQDDYLIVVNFLNASHQSITLNFPDAADCPGRMIVVKRLGLSSGPLTVSFDFNGANLNGNPGAGFTWFGFSSEQQSTFISIGSQGWVNFE